MRNSASCVSMIVLQMISPNNNTVINLSELNQTIADQRGVTVADLALSDAQGNRPEPITEAIAPEPCGDLLTL